MTAKYRDGEEPIPFSAWIRGQEQLSSHQFALTDADYVWHKYKEHGSRGVDCLMLIELKTRAGAVSHSQRDTLFLLDAILRRATSRKNMSGRFCISVPDTRKERIGQQRLVRWFGVHVVYVSNTRPDNSVVIKWDGNELDGEQHLIDILAFKLDPDNPRKPLSLRRHHRTPAREQPTPLAL